MSKAIEDAKQLVREGKFLETCHLLNDAIRDGETSIQAKGLLGMASVRAGLVANAVKPLEEYCLSAPNDKQASQFLLNATMHLVDLLSLIRYSTKLPIDINSLSELEKRFFALAYLQTGNAAKLPDNQYSLINSQLEVLCCFCEALNRLDIAIDSVEKHTDLSNRPLLARYIRLFARNQSTARLHSVEEALRSKLGESELPWVRYELSRYLDVTETERPFEQIPETSIKKLEKEPMRPVFTGASRMVFEDREIETLNPAPALNLQVLEDSIGKLRSKLSEWIADGSLEPQIRNIRLAKEEYAPNARFVQVLSTGRTGTTALQKWLEANDNIEAFHTLQHHLLPGDRNYILYSLLTGRIGDDNWLKTIFRTFLEIRTAELIWAFRHAKSPVIVNHWDVICAPLWAEVFPDSKFIYMARNPRKGCKSVWTKNQWSFSQLMEMPYRFEDSSGIFLCKTEPVWELPRQVAWYYAATALFAEGFARTLPENRIQGFLSEDLFDAKHESFDRLVDFFDLKDARYEDFKAHYARPINEKSEKSQDLTSQTYEEAIDGIMGTYHGLIDDATGGQALQRLAAAHDTSW